VKFEPGDLVMVKSDTPIYYALESNSNVGIVVTTAVLMYAHCSPEGDKINFYAYDVMFDGITYKNVPQEVLRGLQEVENNEEITK
jgi:hypothetical protein